jgi:hypothetical protein
MKLFKYILTGFILIIFGNISAQNFMDQNQPMVDFKRLHFGYLVGLNSQDLHFSHTGIDQNGNKIYSEIPSYSPGFTVGLVGDLALTQYFNLRTVPSLHFGSKDIVYNNQTGVNIGKETIKSNYLMVPLELKYSSLRLNNSRPYLIFGGAAAYDLASKKDPEDLIRLKKLNYFLEIGVGCDLYFEYFKLNPELKICIGLNNVLDKDRPELFDDKGNALPNLQYTNALSKVTSNMIVLSFFFE